MSSEKHRWHDPANEGQVDYVKVGERISALIILLTLATVIKIAITNHWLETFKYIIGYYS